MSRKKIRPQPGDPITRGMSSRDIAATGTLTRRQVQTYITLARIPENDFERLLEAQQAPGAAGLIQEATGRNPARRRAKCCPHCGHRMEEAS